MCFNKINEYETTILSKQKATNVIHVYYEVDRNGC